MDLKNLRIAGWLLILWLLLQAGLEILMSGDAAARPWLDMGADTRSTPGALLRIFFLCLLPLVSVAGLLFGTVWARSACLLSLGAAVFYEGALTYFLFGIYREQQGVMGGDAREVLLPDLLLSSTFVLIHVAFFIAVWGRLMFRTSRGGVLPPAAQEQVHTEVSGS